MALYLGDDAGDHPCLFGIVLPLEFGYHGKSVVNKNILVSAVGHKYDPAPVIVDIFKIMSIVRYALDKGSGPARL